MKKRVLIIGGGLGGLFAGAFLSKEGHSVQVLEKNAIIGGGLQTFRRRNDYFETGMHILGGFQKGGSLNKICEYLGIMDKLSIRHTDDDAIDSITYLSDGETYYIPKGKEAFINYFSAKFPEEKENIKAYTDELYRLSEEVDLFYLRKGNNSIYSHTEHFLWSADQLIGHYIKDPKLQDVLGYMNPMYGGIAKHTPAYIHALINVLYINGSSMFNDGSQQLADLLADIIREGGGEVLAGDPVTHIEVENKTISYVKTQEGNVYQADMYISAIHPCTMLNMITPGAFPRSYTNRLSEIPNSYSAFTAYIKFKEHAFPYINHPCYYQEDYGMVWNHGEFDELDWPKGFMYITPPAKEQGEYARKMIVNCIMDYKVVEQWKDSVVGHRGKEYEEWKQKRLEQILDKLELLYPGFKEKVEYSFTSSPLTIRDYYGVKEGALYGFREDCQNITLSQVPLFTKISNLLLTGQNINLHGICGVPLTAIETVEAIIGRDVLLNKINEHYNALNPIDNI
ncbi:FAD-dependent oxidoreductase [Porphyromonadaceae bacterium OttesenSCG-928-L07]|nr:FAD-dependent oxidoreductase [Porphyromonadaceae bacterium OttesenSCG-928-L07]MDL2251995.1 FAD-dependent oxidoreductase [Odoribacter sp. OttesenSCG-928-J03]MDL2331317.1 FAD-dependent oxidoreductase [Odoribacter sp. OttesenSCG-928-A06]